MRNNLKFQLQCLYFILYGTVSALFPYFTMYFTSKGLSYAEVGIIFACGSLLGALCQISWGYITDKYFNKRDVIILTLLISSLFCGSLLLTRNFAQIMTAYLFFTVFQCAIWSINDAYCYDICDTNKEISFGPIRMFGSIGYAIVALLSGYILKFYGVNFSFYIYIFLCILAIFLLVRFKKHYKRHTASVDLSDIGKVIKDKKMIIFLMSVFTLNVAMGSNGSYISVLIKETGGSISNIGLVWFVVAISELPVLFFGNYLIKKFGVVKILMFASAVFTVRYLLDSLCTNYIEVILLQLLQGISFPFYLIACMYFIDTEVPSKLRTSGITLFNSIGASLGAFFGNISSGFILMNVSIYNLYRILAFVAAVSCFIGGILHLTIKKTGGQGESI